MFGFWVDNVLSLEVFLVYGNFWKIMEFYVKDRVGDVGGGGFVCGENVFERLFCMIIFY